MDTNKNFLIIVEKETGIMIKNITPSFDSCFTVSFSGHRPNKLPGYGDISKPAMAALYQKLPNEIEIAILNDKINFLHGSMAGFDILVAEAVLQLKQKYPYCSL